MTRPSSTGFSQVASVTQLSLQTILERKGAAAAAAFGIAGVVAVLVGRAVHRRRASARRMTVVRRSGRRRHRPAQRRRHRNDQRPAARRRPGSSATRPGVARVGQRARSPRRNCSSSSTCPNARTGTDANVPLRGVEPAAFQVRDNVRIIAGPRFEPGRNEVIVGAGRGAASSPGWTWATDSSVGRSEWTVVGLFTAGGGLAESEIWTDASVLQPRLPPRQQLTSRSMSKLTSAGGLRRRSRTR